MTRIDDLLAKGRSRSFEFFPPKTPEGETKLESAMMDLAALEPTYISVTYGALGTTRDTTRDLVIDLNLAQPFPAMPHLTCVGHTKDQIRELLEVYRDAGIENVLCLGGDPPQDGSDPGGDFTYATELVEVANRVGDFCIGVAAFPEIHPRSPDRATDRRQLIAKLEMADFAITQFSFTAEPYRRLFDELDQLGCDTPVIPGVMPFISVGGTRKMADMNGTTIPDDLQARLDAVDGDAEAIRQLGVEEAVGICRELEADGVAGFHLYALNRSRSLLELHEALGWD